MKRFDYYEKMRELALNLRSRHGINGPKLLPQQLKNIIKKEGVHEIVLYTHFKSIRGCYLIEECGTVVIGVQKGLPRDPYAFTLAHELKHHLVDQEHIKDGRIACTDKNASTEIEIGAEVFAAELLYPQQMFLHDIRQLGVSRGQCNVDHILELKHRTDTTLSYAAIVKRAEYLRLAPRGKFSSVKWKKAEYERFGDPRRFTKHRINQAGKSKPRLLGA